MSPSCNLVRIYRLQKLGWEEGSETQQRTCQLRQLAEFKFEGRLREKWITDESGIQAAPIFTVNLPQPKTIDLSVLHINELRNVRGEGKATFHNTCLGGIAGAHALRYQASAAEQC